MVDGRGPAGFCEPDESTDTGMPVTSRRAAPGTAQERRRNRVQKRPKRPALMRGPLDVISVLSTLAAPSGKTDSAAWATPVSTGLSTTFRFGARRCPRVALHCGRVVDKAAVDRQPPSANISILGKWFVAAARSSE